MITLCGSPISNYYNKVKLALIEKEIPFEEMLVGTGSRDEAVLSISPLGKIPFIKTAEGGLCESEVIVEYLEDAYPQNPLLPKEPFARAKVRELVTFIDWHLEMSARQLYGTAFFGADAIPEKAMNRIRGELQTRIAAFKRIAKFSPYVAGEHFTLADCSAFATFPVISMATKAIYGEDLLEAGGVDHRAYAKLIGERKSAQRVVADRKAASQKR